LHWGEVRPYPEGACYGDRAAPQICNFYRFHSEGLIPIGNSKGGAIGYAQVTEQMNDGRKKIMQFTNGYVHQFNDPLFDGFSNGYYYNSLGNVTIIDHKLFDNSVMRGRMKKAEYYNSNGQIIKKEVHTFSDKASVIGANVPSSDSFFYSVGDLVIDGNVCMGNFASLGLYIFTYEVRPKNVVPVLDSVYYYNGNEILKEVTKYAYNSWEYSNPSRIIKINSLGDTSITHYKYPYDYTISGTSVLSFSKGIKNLQDKHVISSPVESYTEEKPAGGTGKITTAQLVSYKPTLPVPDTVYSLNNTAGLSNFTPAVFTVSTANKDSRYERRLVFDKYDSYGNVTEQRKEGSVKEVLIWGYQKRYIVARITGSDYNTVIALVDTTVINMPSSDGMLRTELHKIRTGLGISNPDAEVTSYTYATLKGLSSMTDPRGETVYYEYDAYGRLKRKKNADGHIKDHLWYHYRP
jgi:YD repeat-containing protein